MKQRRTTNQVLKDAEETLKTAKNGLDDLLKGHPERKLPGLRNLIVFGRAVTNVLQNLRSTEEYFDNWYLPFQEEMKNDSVMSYFYKLRSEILKQGILNVGTSTHLKEFNFPKDLYKLGPPPLNARAFFMGDENGGSGWEVELPNGTKEKYYIDLSSDFGNVNFIFPEPPKNHFGNELKDTSVEHLSQLYYDYLKNLVEKAKDKFIK